MAVCVGDHKLIIDIIRVPVTLSHSSCTNDPPLLHLQLKVRHNLLTRMCNTNAGNILASEDTHFLFKEVTMASIQILLS